MLTALTHTAHKRALSLGLVVLVAITFAGCGDIRPYQPYGQVRLFGLSGFFSNYPTGYFETELSDDQYAVCFMGWVHNSVGKTQAAEDAARLRAAEITLARNYTHFVIESDRYRFFGIDTGWVCDDTGYCDEGGYGLPLATLHIKLLKSPDSSVLGAIDAKSLYDNLAPKYKEPLPSSYTYRTEDPGFKCGED